MSEATFGECEVRCRDTRMVLEERRCRLTLLNPRRRTIRQVRVDGCVLKSGPRCDYLILTPGGSEYFIELKGSDVRHAVRQLEASIRRLGADTPKGRRVAVVASVRCPLVSAEIQNLKVRFKRRLDTVLEVRRCNSEMTLDA